jgi:hypothetical protein
MLREEKVEERNNAQITEINLDAIIALHALYYLLLL